MGSLCGRDDADRGRRHGWLAWAERIAAGLRTPVDRWPRRGGESNLRLESLETRDLMAVADPYITGIELDDGGLDDDGVTEDQTIVLLGTAAADSVVTVALEGAAIGTALADENGQWRFDYSATVLPEGDYDFTVSSPAVAPLGVATDFNLFVFGDLSHQYTDVGGRVAVGGNATVTGYGVGTALPDSNGTRDDFIVGGNLTFTNGQVYNGNVVVGGVANLSSNANILNGTLRHDAPIDFDAAEAALRERSEAYAGLAANGQTINQWGGLTLRGTDASVNVFNVPVDWLNNTWGVTFDVPAGSSVIVNVAGATARMQYFGMNLGNAVPGQILWNFHEATQLTIQGIQVKGSILAPNAAVQFNNGAIDGALVAQSFAGQGEMHNFLLNATWPPVSSQPFHLTIVGSETPPEFEIPSEVDARGVVVNLDADTAWVVDSEPLVRVYHLDGRPRGTWEPIGVVEPGDLYIDGPDLWIADYSAGRAYRFAGGANFRSGAHAATDEFELPADTDLQAFVQSL